jgi:hypothetical protein
MSKIPEPIDCIGNKLLKDDFVTIHFNTTPIFRIIAVEAGGIHTANGITPAVVRVVCDMTLRQMPGVPFATLAKLVQPGTQQIVEAIADKFVKD